MKIQRTQTIQCKPVERKCQDIKPIPAIQYICCHQHQVKLHWGIQVTFGTETVKMLDRFPTNCETNVVYIFRTSSARTMFEK